MFSPIFSYFTIALLVRHLSPTARGVRVRPFPYAHVPPSPFSLSSEEEPKTVRYLSFCVFHLS